MAHATGKVVGIEKNGWARVVTERTSACSSCQTKQHCLQIYDYGTETIVKDGNNFAIEYIVMEFIPGATLRYTMAEEGFYPEENLMKDWLQEYFLPLLNGVEAIHDHDIIHRDLKPENVLLDGSIPKIADFGIARSSWLRPVIQSVDVKGTPAYMSPEHFFDFKKADQQSDIYSLGKILFEAISGKISRETMPFKSVRLSKAETLFFEKLDRIIQDATAEEKGRRPKTIDEFKTLLQETLQILSAEAIESNSALSISPRA